MQNRTRSLLYVLILLIAEPLCAQAFVNHAEGQNATATGVTSLSTATLSTTINNLIVCGVRQDNDTTAPSSLTDTITNTYTHVIASDSSMTTGDLLTIWWAVSSATNAANVVTANWAAAHTFQSILCRQYSGTATTTPADASATFADNTIATSVTSGAFSTAQANEVIVACVSTGSTTQGYVAGLIGGVTATNLFGDAASGSQMSSCEDLIVSSTQTSITAAMSFNSATGREISVLTFKAAAAAAPTGSCTNGIFAIGCR